jgi:Hpt domain
MNENKKKNIVIIDEDLKEIIPGYMKHRAEDLKEIPVLLKKNDFTALKTIGHKLKGSGGGYGFVFFTDLGGRMEEAALKPDAGLIEAQLKEFTDFMETVEIVYEAID